MNKSVDRGRLGVAGAMKLAAIAAMLSVVVGCEQAEKSLLIEAPNRGDAFKVENDPSESELEGLGVAVQFRVEAGPPAASILCWVMDPTENARKAGKVGAGGEPRGTVVMVHGYRNRMSNFRTAAKAIADAGFRVVLMDLRGHGRSTGDYITYGVDESHDLVQVIDALEGRGLIAGKLGVWGISMGASTALMAAAEDERIDTVVAVAPYTTLREVVPVFERNLTGPFADDEKLQALLDEWALEAGFDPDAADALSAVSHAKQPVLIIHGANDSWVPVEHGERLWAAAAGGSHLVVVQHLGHVDAHFDFFKVISHRSIAWFERHLAEDRP